MQRIGQLQAFAELKEGEDGVFLHPQGQEGQSRLIKMRILAEQAVNLYLININVDEDGVFEEVDGADPRFLCHVTPGMEEVEFYWLGSFALRSKGGNIWLDTYDNTSFSVESADPVSFARLWEREERDPRILEIERMARHNRLMLEQQMAEDRAQHAARTAELTALIEGAKNVNKAPSPAEPASGSNPPKSASVPPASDSGSVGAAAAGDEGDA